MWRLLSLFVLSLLLHAAVASAQIAGGGLGGRLCTSKIAINQTTGTTVITGSSGNKIYICSVVLVTAADQSISLVEGTGTVCATSIAAVMGGTTASISLVAQGGLSAVAAFAWLFTATAANNLCLLQSGVANVSGVITYRSGP